MELAQPAMVQDRRLALAAFRDRHRGEAVIVCGCGASLNELKLPPRCPTIGVNDVGRRFDPTYLVVVNPPAQFTGDRFRYVAHSRAHFLFTQRDDLGPVDPPVVRFRLGRFGGTDCDDPERLHYTQNSPYVALCLAAHMGAAQIGLIGVDFTDDHFFAATGGHPLSPQLALIDRQYVALGRALRDRGVIVTNLSARSRLTAFPKVAIANFPAVGGAREGTVKSLNIVSYSTTPVAGVPAILARCIAATSPHRARCVWARSDYGNGVAFDGDVEWSRAPDEAARLLDAADLVVVHNGKVDPAHRRRLIGKPVVTMAHNYRWNVDCGFVEAGFPGVIVGQYQATLPEFAGWSVVPNPLPSWEAAYRPGAKPEVVTIAYTPSGRHERYPLDHRLYWHGKGYDTTIKVLRRLAARHGIRVLATDHVQVSHTAALAMKREAHIVIDECVTGSYHRNSLEGLAAGCVVVNGVGLRPAIADVLRLCAGGADPPFVFAPLEGLEEVLEALIALGPGELAERGTAGRAWLERHWDFAAQWDRFWQPAIDAALAEAVRSAAAPLAPPAVATPTEDGPVSVVIPQGGRDRLPLLTATLAAAARASPVGEIIVAEMDETPAAEPLCRQFGAHYVFIRRDGEFNKARTVNVGTAMAMRELVLWLDNDLLLPDGFLDRAVAELRQRGLDCLIPWTTVHYLSEADSCAVIDEDRPAQACRPVNAYHTRQGACGGAVLVRRALVREFGGLSEAFRGWGGEDNAWFHKARLVGRAAITGRSDQHLYHLFHPRSGGYGTQDHIAANPHYQANVALLYAMRRITARSDFLARHPPPEHPPCPWPRDRRIVLTGGGNKARQRMGAVRQGLWERFGVAAEVNDDGGDAEGDAIVAFDTVPEWYCAHRGRLIVVGESDHVATPEGVRRVSGDAPDLAAALIGPLSIVLGEVKERLPAAAPTVAPGGGAVVVAAGGIGDLIRITPLVRVLARLGHRVEFVIAADYPECAALFRGLPEIDRVVVLPAVDPRHPARPTAEFADADYDVAVVTHLAVALAPQVRARTLHRFTREDWLACGDGGCSERIAAALGWKGPMPPPLARPSGRHFALPEGTVVLHPGCKRNWPWKRWHGFADLARLLPEVAIVGTEEDRATAGTYFRDRPDAWPAHARDYRGALSLPDTAALITEALALVTNDSGLMHLGAALGTPTFAVFGITNPAREIAAAPNLHVITKGLPCEIQCRTQPYGRRDCDRHLQCLKDLTAVEVLDHMQRLMPRRLPLPPPPQPPTPAPQRAAAPVGAADLLTVAIQLEGGLGDIIIAAGFVEALFLELGACAIDVFHHAPDWARFVFRDARFVRSVLPAAGHRAAAARYDIAVYAPQFVHYRVNNWVKLERINPIAAARIRAAGKRFEQYRGLFDRRPHLDALWSRISLGQGRTIFANLDYLGGFETNARRGGFLGLDPSACESAMRLIGGDVGPFITVHDGFDTSQNVAPGTATKCWPIDHWAAFVAQFKAAFPGIRVVQLGAGKSRPIPGADANLIGRTTLDQAAWLLKRAALHVDTDSGLVHLARLVHTTAIALFGPTDGEFYGYAGNGNVASQGCGKCWWSTPDWLAGCPRGLKQPECMASIAPARVLDEARRLLPDCAPARYRLVARQLYDKAPAQTEGSTLHSLFAALALPAVPISRHAVDPNSGIYLHASKQWEYPFALDRIAALAPSPGGLNIADVGAGRGALAPYLATLGHRVTVFDRDYLWDHGGDPNIEARYLRWAGEHGYAARFGSLYNLPAEDDAYDVVLSISVVEHVYAKPLAIGELLRLLKPGGLLVLTFDFASDPARFQDSLRLEIFGPERLADALAAFGIEAPGFAEEIGDSVHAIQRDGVLGIPEGMTVGGIAIVKECAA